MGQFFEKLDPTKLRKDKETDRKTTVPYLNSNKINKGLPLETDFFRKKNLKIREFVMAGEKFK